MKLSTITISLLLAGSTLFAGELEDLKAQMNLIQEKLEKAEKDRAELWEVSEKVETKAFSNKLSWSADLGFRVDSFSFDNNGMGNNIGTQFVDPVPGDGLTTADKAAAREYAFPQEKKWDPHYSGSLKLDAKAQFTNDTSFNGRMIINWSSQNEQRLCILSPQNIGDELPSASSTKFRAIDLDRAYFDYKFNKDGAVPMIASLGILPTTGGLSLNMMEDKPRKSVFPSIMFESNVQGAILTGDLSKVTGMDKTYLRAIYGKAFTLNDDGYYYQCNRENIQNINVMGLFLETELPLFGVENTFWIGINKNADIKATPFLFGSSTANVLYNTSIVTQKNLGDITNYGFGIEATSMADGKLDAFFHYAISDPDSNGECVNYSTNALTNCASSTIGNVRNPGGYYESIAGGTLLQDNGSALYLGVKYDTKSSWETKLGYEFNMGDESWWSATQGSEDPFNKLATRGTVHEAYVIQPITNNISARFGYLRIQSDYTGTGLHFGTTTGADSLKQDSVQENFYLKVNAFF
ncbi:DUF3373 family protein [Candidatus Sulfurimonas baltica]|uniref:DUF3373 family protein n=1 Tax=Candidatus Sulfurimonas baltica TaxID=2740404 RepID=A0A7S7LT47_9BACT|nr:DUF3373 family protein [Candidatus Sulfurimonas baltica]QOY51054.1 DUF3373 family protein [Candidatus Sulfurimonas baltica]